MAFTVNSTSYDWGTMRFAKSGDDIVGINGVSYSHGVESEEVAGAGREPLDYTEGVYKPEDVKVDVLHGYWDAWRNSIGPGYMSKSKARTYTVAYGDDEGEATVDVIVQARVKHVQHDVKRGSGPLVDVVTLQCLKILESGMEPLKTE